MSIRGLCRFKEYWVYFASPAAQTPGKVGAVDCTLQKELCQRFGIGAYPTNKATWAYRVPRVDYCKRQADCLCRSRIGFGIRTELHIWSPIKGENSFGILLGLSGKIKILK